jgi:hypothetical protein
VFNEIVSICKFCQAQINGCIYLNNRGLPSVFNEIVSICKFCQAVPHPGPCPPLTPAPNPPKFRF